MLVRESVKRYFLSWRGRLLLVAEENLRMATQVELALTEQVRDEVVDLQEILRDPAQRNTYHDLRAAKPPPRRPRKPAAPENEERRGARRMLRGSKAVSRLMRQAGLAAPRPRRKKGHPHEGRKKRRSEETASGQEDPAAPAEPEDAFRDPRRDPEPHEIGVPEDDDLDMDPMLDPAQEGMRQEWEQTERAAKRRRLSDDVPSSIKRKLSEFQQELPMKRQRIHAAWVIQALAATTEDGPSNEWVSRFELETLRRLTGLPLSAARVRRSPRKRLMRPPKLVSRARLSILIGKGPTDVFVVEESAKDVSKHPRRKAGFYWKGMTMLIRNQQSSKIRPTYVQMPQGVYCVYLTAKERKHFEELWTEEIRDLLVHEVLLLKLKQTGKELDPKWFSAEEAAAFKESDRKEWQQWQDNQVVRRVSAQEERTIPKHQILRAPLRMVRTNRAASKTLPLVAKSRLVGSRPSRSWPRRISHRCADDLDGRKGIAKARGWILWSFDVTTAFLSGEATDRTIYVRAPPEGLPSTKQLGEISGGELFQVLKSAYGLTEAPRLWYLKACKNLAQTELKELSIAKATYAASDKKRDVGHPLFARRWTAS